MEQPGGSAHMSRSPKFYIPPKVYMWLLTTLIVIFNVAVVTPYFWRTPGEHFSIGGWLAEAGVAAGFTAVVGGFVISLRPLARYTADEAQARQRVRHAEDKLSNQLRFPALDPSFYQLPLRYPSDDPVEDPAGRGHQLAELGRQNVGTSPRDDSGALTETTDRAQEQLAIERQSERLTLAALWDVTHGRMDLYHQIVTGQARRSFGAAQVAMGIGCVLLVVFAVLAAEARTTTAAISAGGLGAVGAAFSGYIARTFIRSQESAASHLRAYFDQPLELSRYLAAERLLADAGELTAEQRAAILSSLVQSIATAGHENGSTRYRAPGPGRAA